MSISNVISCLCICGKETRTALPVNKEGYGEILTSEVQSQYDFSGIRSKSNVVGAIDNILCSNMSVKSKPWRQDGTMTGPKALSAVNGQSLTAR